MDEKFNILLIKAKYLISIKKLKEALSLLKSIPIKQDDDIKFEIAKIYMISKKYDNSLKLLKEIKKVSLMPYVYDMVFKIYKLLGDNVSLIKIYNKNFKYYEQNIEYTKNIIDVLISTNRYKNVLNILSIYKSKYGNDSYRENKLKEVYKKICIYIQKLNIENKYIGTKKFFSDIYKLIPVYEYKTRNILLNEYEIASNKIILRSIPRQLTVLLTDKCNLRCIMCKPYDVERECYELSNENYKELLKIIPYLDRLILQGGETLLYKNFYNIIKKACEEKVCVEMITNGLLLNEKIIKILININSVLTISIDGFNKKTYEKIRVGGKFENLIAKLDLLNKFKKNKSDKMFLRLQMVVMKSNYKQINMALDFAKKYCFDEVSLIPIRSGVALSEECIFDLSYNEKILKYLNSNKYIFEKKARTLNLKLINKLPNISESDCKMKIKIEHTPILDDNVIKLKNVYRNINVRNNNIFCFLPWKTAYYNGISVLPTCFCPGQSKDFIYKKHKKSILEEWNKGTILFYRKKIIERKENLICNNLCLNADILQNERKMIIY